MFSAIPAGSVLHITTSCSSRTRSSMFWCAMSRRRACCRRLRAFDREGRRGLVTSGPGATNAVTGIATAYMDSIPMVVISGQVPTAYIGQDAFQECDTVGITRPCVKHNFLVKDVRISRDHQEGLLHRQHRPSGPGAWSTFPRTSRRTSASSPTRRRFRCAPTTRWSRGTAGQIKKAVQLLLEPSGR
jgi:acetolactate synthase-1/2/3 large subunit